MATYRDRPYPAFNFLVDLGGGDTKSPQAGFQEISGLGHSIDIVEYRAGNHVFNSPIKINGLNRATDVTLKRGLIGSLDLHQWMEEVRNGQSNGLRTVSITLLNEAREPVVVWKLANARIRAHRCGPLHAATSALTIEEMVIACERLEME